MAVLSDSSRLVEDQYQTLVDLFKLAKGGLYITIGFLEDSCRFLWDSCKIIVGLYRIHIGSFHEFPKGFLQITTALL